MPHSIECSHTYNSRMFTNPIEVPIPSAQTGHVYRPTDGSYQKDALIISVLWT
jgi:hypothetical protein